MKESNIVICGHGSGHPRTTRMDEYNSYRYAQKVTKDGKTWRKGLVAVMRPKALTDDLRAAYCRKYSTIIGRNYYSQTKRKYCYTPYSDGKYYSDCSSSQCLTLSRIGLDMPDYNTEAMYESSRFEKVPVTIKEGHIVNPEVLKIGDMLLYAGASAERKLHIGHVEGVFSIGADSDAVVYSLQKFLNENYAQILKTSGVGLLTKDGDYGAKTRAAALAVWKYMTNKYEGSTLTVGNDNFYETSEAAAEKVTNAEIMKHPTFAYILQGVLTGKGHKVTKLTGRMDSDTLTAIRAAQKSAKLPQTGDLSGKLWKYLFN